jgi:ubiquinone biosynthesis protein
MIRTLIVATRDRGRLAEITAVATRYGLGVLLARSGLDRPAATDEGAANEAGLPRRIRLALEELGPTFVKLGQILATRADLLPAEWIAELEQLHSQAPTLPFDALRMAVEATLGQPPEDAFLSFDPVPLAAASMAQVHRATLTDGRPIVLKIRRPDIRPRMEADLRLIAHLAAMVESASAEARRFSPSALVRQLAEAVLEELDFTNEGRNADRLRDDFANDPRVVIPTIHWQWSSEALLVMDYVDGIPPRNGDDLSRAGIDPAAIAELGADIVLDMVLINGRFHGDPHPGNLLCLPGNRIALLDMGMVGHVGPRRRQEILRFVQALSAGDAAALADIIAVWSAGGGATREQILRASERLVARHAGGALVLGAVIADFFPLLREERLVLPPDLLLIFKALVTIDGVLTGIVPGFDLSNAIARSKFRIMRDRLSPERWAPTVEALLIELVRVGDDAPRLLRAAVKRLEAEPAASGSDERLVTAVTSAGRWIAAAIVLAAVMVAAMLIRGQS